MAAKHQRHRPDGPDTWHHVWNRGVRKTPIFGDDLDCRIFLEKGEEAAEVGKVDVVAYCLVGNHYHYLARSRAGQISKTMQLWAANYTRWFNNRYGVSGPLWESRFGSRLIDGDSDLLMTSRYVHRNALDIAPDAPLRNYRWSSMAAYLGRAPDLPSLSTETILALGGGSHSYRKLVERAHPSDKLKAFRRDGLPDFRRANSPDLIDAVVIAAFGCDDESLRGSTSRSRNPARRVAVLLCSELTALPPQALAERYGYTSSSQLGSARSKFRVTMQMDPILTKRIADLRRRILSDDAAA